MKAGKLRGIFEHRRDPLIPRRAFLFRQVQFAGLALVMVVFSLGIGMLGYRSLEGMAWIDAFLNAAMIMGGMGPAGELHTSGGKFFAGCYALYCGLILLVSASIFIAPMFHRFLHRFHIEAGPPEKQ
jgi:hypothetical protein